MDRSVKTFLLPAPNSGCSRYLPQHPPAAQQQVSTRTEERPTRSLPSRWLFFHFPFRVETSYVREGGGHPWLHPWFALLWFQSDVICLTVVVHLKASGEFPESEFTVQRMIRIYHERSRRYTESSAACLSGVSAENVGWEEHAEGKRKLKANQTL